MERAFAEKPAFGPNGPNYGITEPLMMDISDLMNSYYVSPANHEQGQALFELYLKRFNAFYGTDLKPIINHNKAEVEYYKLDDGEHEFETIEEFVEFYNKSLL